MLRQGKAFLSLAFIFKVDRQIGKAGLISCDIVREMVCRENGFGQQLLLEKDHLSVVKYTAIASYLKEVLGFPLTRSLCHYFCVMDIPRKNVSIDLDHFGVTLRAVRLMKFISFYLIWSIIKGEYSVQVNLVHMHPLNPRLGKFDQPIQDHRGKRKPKFQCR